MSFQWKRILIRRIRNISEPRRVGTREKDGLKWRTHFACRVETPLDTWAGAKSSTGVEKVSTRHAKCVRHIPAVQYFVSFSPCVR